MTIAEDGSSRLLKRWPGLPVLSLGFFLAYAFCLFSNTISASAPRASLAFYSTILIMFVIAAILPDDLKSKFDNPKAIWAFGLLTAIGTIMICSAGFLEWPANYPLVMAGAITCAIGSSGIALKPLMLLGRLNVTSIWIWMAFIELVVVGLYFAIAASPLFVNGIVLTVLPIMASGCINLSYRSDSYFSQEEPLDDKVDVSASTLLKFFAFVFLVSVTACFGKEISFIAIAENGLLSGLAWPAWERVAIAAFILIALVYFAKQFPFSKMCLFAVVVLIAMIACLAFMGEGNAGFFFLSTLTHSTIECATLAFAACLLSRSKRNSVNIAAISLACLYGGSVIGYWTHFAMPLDDEAAILTLLFYITAALTVVMALVFFQERTFDALLGSVDEEVLVNVRGSKDGEEPADDTDPDISLTEKLTDEYQFSARECQVALVMRSGKTVNRIAEEMHLSVYTVRGYIQSIYSKCGVHSKDEFLDLIDKLSLT